MQRNCKETKRLPCMSYVDVASPWPFDMCWYVKRSEWQCVFELLGGISACWTNNSIKYLTQLHCTTDCMACSCCGCGPFTRDIQLRNASATSKSKQHFFSRSGFIKDQLQVLSDRGSFDSTWYSVILISTFKCINYQYQTQVICLF